MNPDDDDDDIARLFAQFGGDPDTYQEIATVAAAREARSRWPVLSAFDPLASTAAPAVGVDDAAVVAQARRAADDAHDHEAAPVRSQAQFMPPKPKPFSREIPDAFLVPIAAAATAQAPSPALAPAPRVEPTITATPAPATHAGSAVDAAAPVPTLEAAPGPTVEPTAATPASAPAPSAETDPFRRLAASHGATAGSPRLPDLFNRLLSS